MPPSAPPQSNIVTLFAQREVSEEAAGRAKVVRAFAEATASLGRAAQLIDEGPLDPETSLALVRSVKELVIRTFAVNAAYMEAEAETFRMRPSDTAPLAPADPLR